jgi:hypothetical protein
LSGSYFFAQLFSKLADNLIVRLGLTIVALLGVGLAGCDGGLNPAAPAGPVAAPNISADASVAPIKATDIAGTYTIDTVTFDADLAKDVQPPVTLTRTLTTHTISTNGKAEDIQARLGEAYVIMGPAGNFTFYYSVVNQKGEPVQVGAFKSGSMSGTLKLEVSSIGFSAGVTNGLADEQESMYVFKKDKKTITLTDVVKETPTPHFSIITATQD